MLLTILIKQSFSEADINSMPKGISELSSDKTIGIMPKNYDKLTNNKLL